MTGDVLRAGGWSIGGQLLTLVASLVATPFVIRFLGPKFYGLLALLNVLVGYLTWADLGMSVASSKLGSDAYANADDKSEVSVVWTSLLLAGVPLTIAGVLLWTFAGEIVDGLLDLDLDVSGPAIVALRVASVGLIARGVANVLNTPQIVRMRPDLYVGITSGGAVIQISIVPLVLWAGGGLVAAVFAATIVSVAVALLHLGVSTRLQPNLWPPRISLSLIRPLMTFGSAMVLSYMTLIVLQNSERLVLARLGSVTEVGYYSVAAAAAAVLNIIPYALTQPLLAAFALLSASDRPSEMGALYARLLRLTFLAVIPVVVFLFAFARPFFAIWAGELYARNSTAPFYLLVIGLAFNAIAAIPSNLLTAANKAGLIARYHLAEIIPYLAAAVVLIRFYGATGAAAAWTARSVVNTGLYLWGARRVVSIALRPNWSGFKLYTVSLALVGGPLAVCLAMSLPAPLIATVGFFSVSIYSLLLWFRILSDDEKAWVKRAMALFSRQRFRRQMGN